MPGRFQFKLATLLLAMVVISVMAALFGPLFRAAPGASDKPRLVLLTLVAPTGLIVLVAVVRLLIKSRGGSKRKRW